MKKDYYSTLWVAKTASEADIKKAYKKLAMQYHPDRNKGDKKAEEKFKEINEAYQVLWDKEKKKNYDQFGSAEGNPFGWMWWGNPFGWYSSSTWFDGFDDIFSQFGGGNSGFDFDLGDIFGGTKTKSRTKTKTESKTEENLDVTETLEIPFFDFLFDTTVPVKTVYGKVLSLKIKAWTKPGTKFKISAKGRTAWGKTGDMYVVVDAKMPKTPLEPWVERMIEAIRYQI